ncbi:Gfo/Idh/MocA-like oxidoreductase N-terminal domain-containing protein [Pleurotus pulmonarius]
MSAGYCCTTMTLAGDCRMKDVRSKVSFSGSRFGRVSQPDIRISPESADRRAPQPKACFPHTLLSHPRPLMSGIAILGAGIFAKEAHLPALAKLGVNAPILKAVYSRSEKSAHDVAAAAAATLKLDPAPTVYHDGGDPSVSLDALLTTRSDIDAVIVVLPITLQPSIIIKALAAGKHVLSEKPVAPDTSSGLSLIAKYNEEYKPKGLVWRVAENFEAEPGYQAAATAIREGKIGKVSFFDVRVVNYIDKESKWYKTPWRTVPDYQGGFLLDGGVHTAAALRVMLPSPLTHLSGFASLNKDYLPPHDTITAVAKSIAKDSTTTFHGTASLTWASPTPSKSVPDGITITGSDGWLSATSIYAEGVVRITIKSVVHAEGKPDEEREEIIDEPIQGVQRELESFFAATKGTDDGLGDPLGALRDVAFIQAGLDSNGALVDLEKLISSD